MSDVDVAAIREALSKATPGDWYVGEYGRTIATDAAWGEPWLIDIGDDGGVQRFEDAELIVLLRNNAEALLDALEDSQREYREPCNSEIHSWDKFRETQVDSYWMRCSRFAPHPGEDHEDSNTGATWTDREAL